MKALTLWQPYASLCVEERPCPVTAADDSEWCTHDEHDMWKQIETRSWCAPASLIGQRLAIHAAKREPTQPPVSARPMIVTPSLNGSKRMLAPSGMLGDEPLISLPLGAIVGTAVVADCVPMIHNCGTNENAPAHLCWGGGALLYHRPVSEVGIEHSERDISDQLPFGHFEPSRWAWLLTDAVKLPEPIPCKGRQGVWNVPFDLEDDR